MNVVQILLTLVFCSACLCISADTVELRNGQKTQGIFKQADVSKVSIIVGGKLIQFDTKDVKYISFIDEQPTKIGTPFFNGKESEFVTTNSKEMDEALASLKAFRSVVNSNPTYSDFSSRLIDTRIIVDRYLNNEKFKDDKFRVFISDAMSLYSLGGSAWGASSGRTQGDFNTLATLGTTNILSCYPDILSEADKLSKRAKRDTWEYGFAIANNLKLIFDSASTQIDSCAN